jgi:hypothetical protein
MPEMLKTHYGPRTVAEAMIDYLNHCDDWDEQIINQGETLRLYGRRIVYTSDFGSEEYVRCATVTEAIAEFDRRRFPDQYDAIIYEGREYHVEAEGVRVGDYETREEAEFALAKWMVDNGCFPASWFINERGNYFDIDATIREYHDEGGDKMHPRFTEGAK